MSKPIKEVKAKEVVEIPTIKVVEITPKTETSPATAVVETLPTKRQQQKDNQIKTREEIIKVITDVSAADLFCVTVLKRFSFKKDKPENAVVIHGKALTPVMTGIPLTDLSNILRKEPVNFDFSWESFDDQPAKQTVSEELFDLYVYKINKDASHSNYGADPISQIGNHFNNKNEIYQILAIDSKSSFILNEDYSPKYSYSGNQDAPDLFDGHGTLVVKESKLSNVVFSGNNLVSYADIKNTTLIGTQILPDQMKTSVFPSQNCIVDACIIYSKIFSSMISSSSSLTKNIFRSSLRNVNIWSANMNIVKSVLHDFQINNNAETRVIIKSSRLKKFSINGCNETTIIKTNYSGNGEVYRSTDKDSIRIESIFDLLKIDYSNDEIITVVKTKQGWSANISYNEYENVTFDLMREVVDKPFDGGFPRPGGFTNCYLPPESASEYDIAQAIKKATSGLGEWGSSVLTKNNEFTQEIIRHLSKTIADRIHISRKISSMLEVTYFDDDHTYHY